MSYSTVIRAAGKAANQGRFVLAANLFASAARKAPNARAAFFNHELSRDYALAA